MSSASTTRAASLAASVPLMPMAMPTSARFSAGASLTPSPVIATTCSCGLQRLDQPQLVLGRGAGEHVDLRRARGAARRRPSPRSRPRSAPPPEVSSPSSSAIASAVSAWSPVIILTSMPARRQSATAAIASGRGGSMKPASPSSVRPLDVVHLERAPPRPVRVAKASTRCPLAASSSSACRPGVAVDAARSRPAGLVRRTCPAALSAHP